ncbi:unnamed protein product [Mesocestoides corti]|uniref:Usp domain-containing protein n=1 Tax=Mesocestoides corti TaxID=53468 RepID=A0A0R3U9A4_MESCO|nr:unnamed protein product [Mesocestoides corti]
MAGHRRILFAVDESASCRRAFQWFLRWMWRSGSNQEEGVEDAITLIHVIAPELNPHPSVDEAQMRTTTPPTTNADGAPLVMEEAFAAGKALCQGFLDLAFQAGATHCDACIAVDRRPATGKAVIKSALIRGVDMIVMGSRGRGALHRTLHLGSVGKYIVRHSHIPVTVIPPNSSHSYC